jgi:TetR/AcrR family transcriptional repressor of uid operon
MRTLDPIKHEEKRAGILAAAARCFARDGFRGASIADICAEAAISPGHLYHYFPSKEAIMSAMTKAGLARANERFREMMASSNAVEALLAEIGRPRPTHERPNPVVLLDMLAEAGRNPEIGKIVRDHSRDLRALVEDFLRASQKRGHIDRSLAVRLAAAILLSVLDGAKTLKIRDPKLDMAGAAALLRTLIERFLTPQPAGADPHSR